MEAPSPRVLVSDEPETSETTLVIFFIFCGLLVGIITRGLKKITGIPYTPILLVLGLAASRISPNVRIIGEATDFIANIDPEGILLIFIPILIFESSFKADWHVFRRSMKQILILAGPGVVISFALIAVAMKVILRYDDDELSWSSALMFGSIVAATDPVAVVALLKELGAPHYFSSIVEGESLLNDGTGVVFFSIFWYLASGKDMTIGLGFASFFFLCLGGVAIGLVFSFIVSYFLKRILTDSVLSISIIVTASYLLFWVAETFKASFTTEIKAGVSGIIGLCTLGLYLSAYGKIKISSRVEHPLNAVVAWAQYVSETLIFLLTGLLVGKALFEAHPTIVGWDWLKLFFFFLLVNVIRGIVVLILTPWLNISGYKMNYKELIVLSYGGLRGALGLSLALSIDKEEGSFSRRTRELILFYVAGTATLTLLINGTTAGLLVKKIKMIKHILLKDKIFENFEQEAKEATYETYSKIKQSHSHSICDWEMIRKLTDLSDNSSNPASLDPDCHQVQRYASFLLNVNGEELLKEARYIMLRIFKGLLWERHESGEIGGHGAEMLDKAVNSCIDDLQARINIFEFLYNYYVKPSSIGIMMKLRKIPLIGRYFRSMVVHHMILIYDASTALVEIIDELKSNLDILPIPQNGIHQVIRELENNQSDALAYINNLKGQFLEIIRYVTTKHLTKKILTAQRNFVTERYHAGIIEEKEYDILTSRIDKKIRNLHNLIKIKWEPCSFSNLIVSFPVFNLLSQEQANRILHSSKEVRFKLGEALFEEGKLFDSIYLITRGEVDIMYKDLYQTKRGVGSLVSFFNLVMFDNVSRIKCVASQRVDAHRLDLKALREIMHENKEFEEEAYKEALSYLRYMKPDKASELTELTHSQIKLLARSAKVTRFILGEFVDLPNEGFVLKGNLERGSQIYDEYCFLSKDPRLLVGRSEGLVVKFNMMQKKDLSSSSISREITRRICEFGLQPGTIDLDKEGRQSEMNASLFLNKRMSNYLQGDQKSIENQTRGNIIS